MSALIGGRYQVQRSLGVGGTAAVYAASDLLDAARPEVAIKVLHPTLSGDPAVRAAFLREGERVAGLNHPNIVAVRDWGTHDAGGVELAWIAFDRVPGGDLADWVAANGPMPPEQAAAVMADVLRGLDAAHRAGLVHRDLSPRNVLLDDGVAKIVDFGLADGTGRTAVGADPLLADTDPRGVVGSAQYMSPEQAAGQPVGPAGDLYAAGAVLYFLLTGEQPYPRQTTEQVVQAVLAAPPPVPSAVVAAARRLDVVVTTAMTKDPHQRFADADAFIEALAVASTRPTAASVTSTRVLPALASAPGPARRAPTSAGWIAGVTAAVILAMTGAAAYAGVSGAFAPQLPVPVTSSATPSPSPSEAKVVVPAVFGSIDQAEQALASAGLRIGTIRKADSAENADTVLSQKPAAGKKVAAGTAVNLVIATGLNVVPRLTGLTAAAAGAKLTTAGFSVSSDQPDLGPTAVVVGSTPASGTRERLGVTVTLLVQAPAEPSAEPSASPSAPTPSPSASPAD